MENELHSEWSGADFFGTVRHVDSQNAHLPPLGRALNPAQERIRFSQPPSLAFQSRTSEPPEPDGDRLRIAVHFLGLLGPNGPLPAQLTEFVRDRLRNSRDGTHAAFLDVFHHRALSFFFRAWAINDKASDFDRPAEARFPMYLGSFFGECSDYGGPTSLPERAKLYYSGQLGRQTRCAEGLEAILGDFFEVPTIVEPLVAQWLALARDSLCGLGVGPETATLGVTAVIGEQVWDAHTRFRVHIGPVGLSRYRDFLPGSQSAQRLVDWVRHYALGEFQWDLHLTLLQSEVPPTVLGSDSQLGWTSWLLSGAASSDADDPVLILQPSFPHHN